MKLTARAIVNTGLYMHIEFDIPIDTENYAEAKRLVQELHANFYGLLNGLPKDEIDIINADIETKKELKNTDWHMQSLFDKVRQGKTIPVEVWQKLTPSDQNVLHKALLQHNQDQRLNKKDELEKSGKGK